MVRTILLSGETGDLGVQVTGTVTPGPGFAA